MSTLMVWPGVEQRNLFAANLIQQTTRLPAQHIEDRSPHLWQGTMAFALRLLFLVCGISGLLTGVWSFKKIHFKDNNCPKGWTRLDCHCYIYQDDPRTFADAESVCNILEANLVSIHNDLENAFVVQLVRAGGNDDLTWIGFTDAIEEGDFIWTDGTEQDFLNFDQTASPPEPSGTGDCVVLDESDGLWQDEQCTDEEPYVCIKAVFH